MIHHLLSIVNNKSCHVIDIKQKNCYSVLKRGWNQVSFSENLKRIRIQKGISQQALSKMVGVSQTAVYHWEKGERIPKIGAVARIASALDVSIEDFFTEVVNGESVINFDGPGLSPDDICEYIEYIAPEQVYSASKTNSNRINELFNNLNGIGQDKAVEQVELLTKIPEYQKKNSTE